VQRSAEALIALAREQKFFFWETLGRIELGWALTKQGQEKEGIEQMREGVKVWRAEGPRPMILAWLAEAYGDVGQLEEGLAVVAEGLAEVEKTGARFYEVELYRLRGELTLTQSRVQRLASGVERPQSALPNPQLEAETCFHKAIDIARKQQAKSLELRATMSLARLWQHQGNRREAHEMLLEIYSWFTEGFDTKDLQEAKALLEQLAEGR
jgi:predicted ATPase